MLAPKLSIVTITYKDPVGLEKTIQSLKSIHSIGLKWEHVIVDSSPEQNAHLISTLPSGWPLHYFKESPRGIREALNSGMKHAQGELIWFLNGGDRLKGLEVLQRILNAFQSNTDLDIACAGVDFVRGEKYLYPFLPHTTFLSSILGANRLPHQGMIYKRESLLKVGPFLERYKQAADYQHHFRCYLAGLKAQCFGFSLALYEMGGDSDNHRNYIALAKQIHREMNPNLPRLLRWIGNVKQTAEAVRLHFVKSVAKSPAGDLLRPLWLKWNRTKSFFP